MKRRWLTGLLALVALSTITHTHAQSKDDAVWKEAMLSNLAQVAAGIKAISNFCQTRALNLYQEARPVLETFRETNKEMIRTMEESAIFASQEMTVKTELEQANDVEKTCRSLAGEARFAAEVFNFYRAAYPEK